MSLEQTKFLIIDCQTTGMRPSVGHLLEISWAWATAASDEIEVQSFLVKLPPRAWIPARVQEITGIKDSDLEAGTDIEDVRAKFLETLAEAGEAPVTALIHYSQFEEPFLIDFLKSEFDGKLPFKCICTHKLAKKLFPSVPSRNIRGLTGFFGSRIGEIKRAPQHVRATHLIWKGLAAALKETGCGDLEGVERFLAETPPKAKKGAPKPKAPSYEYRVAREKRLALPDRPGIYKMKDKDGHILYVGKATSLKDRVNSYFRGKKGRDPRKLEMMAQVWDLETVECGSAIEAALIESDEIKRLDPPYNVSLKGNRRAMMFYSRDFETDSVVQDSDHPIGPFRRFNSIDHLRTLVWGLQNGNIINVFHQPIDAEVLEAGYELFLKTHAECGLDSPRIRDHIAIGLWLTKKAELTLEEIEAGETEASGTEGLGSVGETKPGDGADRTTVGELRYESESLDGADEESDESDSDEELTAEDLAGKFERLYMRAAASYLRSKLMTSLLWSDVRWTEKDGDKRLSIRHGQLGAVTADGLNQKPAAPWEGLKISDYDRMSILLAEIARFPHEIETL